MAMKNTLRNITIIIVVGLIVMIVTRLNEPTPIKNKIDQMEIICYSCGRGENPENSLKGIRHCQSVNPNWRIEMDIQITSDDKLVLFHDYETTRTTGENLQINELTLDELKELNAGFNFKVKEEYPYRDSPIRIPELKDVFNEFPKAKLLLDIHTNNSKVVDLFIDLIEMEFKQGDFIVVSEYDEVIKKLRKEKQNWIYGVPANEAKKMLYSSFFNLDGIFPIKSDILMIPKKYGNINVISKRVVNHAKIRNKPIWAWMYEGDYVKTVESKTEMEELGSIGVTGIFTGFPQKLSNEIR